MAEGSEYFIVRKKAVPEVLRKVVETKMLIESGKAISVQEATEITGISRSSFYKYKEDIFPFHDSAVGKTITFTCEIEDEPGVLSDVLKVVAEFGANILTIHQTIPINNVATLSLNLQILPSTGDVSKLTQTMEETRGVRHVKILARE